MNNNICSETNPVVLIVDDSNSIQRYVKELLKEAGFRTFSAMDGRTGLESIKSCCPDVVLLDIEMPEMSGLEVLDAIGNAERLYSVLLFSHLSGTKNRIAGLEKGADDYITKPIEPDELIARVKAASRTNELKKQLASARHTAEDALKKFSAAQDKLIEEQKISAVARLAALIAHEINNPLGFIKSNFNTIEKYSDKLLSCAGQATLISDSMLDNGELNISTIKPLIEEIKKSKIHFIRADLNPLIAETTEGIDRISAILKRLLLLDRAASNATAELTNIDNLIRHFHEDERFVSNSNIVLKTKLQISHLPVCVNADQIRISIENILANAIDSISEHGEIEISTYIEDQKWVIIEVKDSGDGIPDDILPQIFEPFFSTHKSPEIIGLGLTIAHLFIQAHCGQILVNSNCGKGTCMTIRLPFGSVENNSILSSAHAPAEGASV